jgi:hypothetical protein
LLPLCEPASAQLKVERVEGGARVAAEDMRTLSIDFSPD